MSDEHGTNIEEKIYDRVFSQIDEELPKLLDSILWEDQRFIDTYHDIRNQLVSLIVEMKGGE